ncbi:MAG UNVERIFIED_CONTAM: hypothetical protein LVT10_10830 [Anaerolineae bacterium]
MRELWSFVPANDGLFLLLPIGIDLTARQYVLSVSVGYPDRTRTLIETLLTVGVRWVWTTRVYCPPGQSLFDCP